MSELPGTTTVDIETVEWLAESAGTVTVRVTGRWRRRRPATSGPAALLIEVDGQRHRFPAMPEPPSLAGAGPGLWRLSFAVPEALAPDPSGPMWLALGPVSVALPAAVTPAGAPPAAGLASVTELFSEGSPRLGEMAATIAALEEDLAQARAAREELAASLAERERVRRIAEQRAHAEQALRRELADRLTDSRRETERARRALGDLATAEERIRSLEEEVRRAQRLADEAEQAAASVAARERAARRSASGSGSAEISRLRLERDLVRRRAGVPAVRMVSEPPGALRRPVAAAPAPSVVAPRDELEQPLVDLLRRELDARVSADASVRARLIDAEGRLAARATAERRTDDVLGQLRRELASLRAALARERALRDLTERRAAGLERELHAQRDVSRRAHAAIGELRQALERLATPLSVPLPRPAPVVPLPGPAPIGPLPGPAPIAPVPGPAPAARAAPSAADPETEPRAATADVTDPAPEAPAAGLLEPARLNDALSRLRQTIPSDVDPPAHDDDDHPAGPTAAAGDVVTATTVAGPSAHPPSVHEALGRPRLDPAFRRLARSDADVAGRLVLELLPLQRIVYPRPVSYDVVLGERRGCVWVSVSDGTTEIAVQTGPRPLREVDFQVVGEPARIARLLTAGRLRRITRVGLPRIRGRRDGVAALRALLGAPLDLRALVAAGVRPDAEAALGLAAGMIDPAATAGHRFALACQRAAGPVYLLIRGGSPPLVTRADPQSGAAARIACPSGDLLAVLAGEDVPGLAVEGDGRALDRVREWLDAAQSGEKRSL